MGRSHGIHAEPVTFGLKLATWYAEMDRNKTRLQAARENIATLNRYGVRKIVTSCPHCLNALKCEYPQFGGRYEVLHHSVLLDDLLRRGAIRLEPGAGSAPVGYHDPCYLARYHGVVDPPRTVLTVASGSPPRELEHHRAHGLCCGGGGGGMWLEDRTGARPALARAREAAAAGVATLAAACPFCLTMLGDGMKELGAGIEVKDLAEIVLEALPAESREIRHPPPRPQPTFVGGADGAGIMISPGM